MMGKSREDDWTPWQIGKKGIDGIGKYWEKSEKAY